MPTVDNTSDSMETHPVSAADRLIANFDLFDDWEERYRYIIDLGRKLPPMPDADKTEGNKVQGCISQVWMSHRPLGGEPMRLHFSADSDAFIVKGLIAILLALYNERPASEILAIDAQEKLAPLGLERHLSINRRSGFVAMAARIREIATAYLPNRAQEESGS